MRICRKTRQSAIDLPLGRAQATAIFHEPAQGFCPRCGQSETVRPPGIPAHGEATPRFTRSVSRLCRFVPASRQPEVLGVSEASSWRYDRHILSTEMPPPSLEAVEALLTDEVYRAGSG